MRWSYDFLPADEREWVERCHSLAVVVWLVVLALAAGAFAQGVGAQTCSGGPGGGMDATGCDCNMPAAVDARAIQARSGVFTTSTRAGHALQAEIDEYDQGNYRSAVLLLKQAAEAGDVRAAEVLSLMYRFGKQLFADPVPTNRVEAAHFGELAARSGGGLGEAEAPAP